MTWRTYLVEVDLARNRYPEIEIVTGVEADYLPDRMDEVRATLRDATRRSDGASVVLGSVHLLGGWTFDDPQHDRVVGVSQRRPRVGGVLLHLV